MNIANMYKKNREVLPIIIMGISATADLIDSLIIHLKEIASHKDPSVMASCKINSLIDCGTVANSSYSQLLGIPVSLIGIIFSEAVLLLSVVLFFGFNLKKWMKWLLSAIFVVSLSFSLYLISASYFGLGVFCPYCLVSNISTLMIFISWFMYLANNKQINPNNEKK